MSGNIHTLNQSHKSQTVVIPIEIPSEVPVFIHNLNLVDKQKCCRNIAAVVALILGLTGAIFGMLIILSTKYPSLSFLNSSSAPELGITTLILGTVMATLAGRSLIKQSSCSSFKNCFRAKGKDSTSKGHVLGSGDSGTSKPKLAQERRKRGKS